MPSYRPTVADLLSMRGKKQIAKLRVETLDEAEAAERAGIGMLSVPPILMANPAFREAAPTAFAVTGLEHGRFVTAEDYLRAAFQAKLQSSDAVYCAASLATIRTLREEGIPVVSHVGLIPSHRTWTGGFKAVGKTFESAWQVWQQTKALEDAGAFAAEIEVVPVEIASAVATRTGLFMISMGAGGGCHAQYLFADDVLGAHGGHYPRHAKVYRNFRAEYERLQKERVAAFTEYAADVESGVFPAANQVVGIDKSELDRFLKALETDAD